MITFNKLAAKDFMALGDVEYLFTPDKVRLLLGRNEDSLTADDNGSGKSSLAEALRWCLYGETVRQCLDKSLGVDHVIRRGQKKTVVGVDFEVQGTKYKVTRERNRTTAKLTLSVQAPGSTVWSDFFGSAAQEHIDTALGINVIQFSNLVYLDGSYPLLFAPSTDRTRKDILADLVDVAITQQMEAEVKKQLTPIQKRSDELAETLRRCDQAQQYQQEQQDKAKEQGKTLTATCRQLEIDGAEAVKTLTLLQEQMLKLRDAVGNAQQDFVETIFQLEECADSINHKHDEVSVEYNRVKDSYRVKELEEVKGQLDSCTREVTTREKRIKDIRSLQDKGKCPTCGQTTDEVGTDECTTLEREIREYKDAFKGYQDTRTALEKERGDKLEEAASLVTKERADWFLAKDALANYRKEGSGAEALVAEFKKAEDAYDIQNEKVQQLKSDYKVKRALLQQAKDTHAEAKEKLKQLDKDKKRAVAEAAELTKQADKLLFWKAGFGPKGVPSLFIETVLPRISSRIQHFANILTGGDVMVQLKAYKETKSNTIQEAIQIEAVNSKGASVYGANSTGERNRINLAVTLGLMDYFRSTNVFESNLLVCDEIFDGLDSTGVEAALEALHESHVSHILVISHHEHLKPMFPEIIYAHKQHGVASLEI